MPPYAEAAVLRHPLRPLMLAVVSATSIALSACAGWRTAPAPLVVAPPPVVVVAAPPPVVEAPPPAPPPAPEPLDAATPGDLLTRRALTMHEQLRLLPPNELAQEITRLSALPAAPETSIDLAMALLLTRNGGEQNRAIALVEPLAKSSAPELRPWQPIARLLLARLFELRRLEDLLDRRNQELRETQRELKQVNEKLEALKAIERSLAPRPVSSAPPGVVNSSASGVLNGAAGGASSAPAPAAAPAPGKRKGP